MIAAGEAWSTLLAVQQARQAFIRTTVRYIRAGFPTLQSYFNTTECRKLTTLTLLHALGTPGSPDLLLKTRNLNQLGHH